MNEFNKVIEYFGNTVKTAEALGISVQSVCFYRDGKRKLPPEICTRCEQLTHGTVTRQTLMPNKWKAIWPELAKKKHAA